MAAERRWRTVERPCSSARLIPVMARSSPSSWRMPSRVGACRAGRCLVRRTALALTVEQAEQAGMALAQALGHLRHLALIGRDITYQAVIGGALAVDPGIAPVHRALEADDERRRHHQPAHH